MTELHEQTQPISHCASLCAEGAAVIGCWVTHCAHHALGGVHAHPSCNPVEPAGKLTFKLTTKTDEAIQIQHEQKPTCC